MSELQWKYAGDHVMVDDSWHNGSPPLDLPVVFREKPAERWFVRLGEVNSEGNRPAGYAYSEASDTDEFEAIPAGLAEDIRKLFSLFVTKNGSLLHLVKVDPNGYELAASIKRRLEGTE
jgi:hypothetical protein